MKEKLTNLLPIIKYLGIALFDTIVSYSVYYLVLFANSKLYVMGSIFGFTASTLCAFYLNTRFVFTPEGTTPEYTWKGLIKTFSTYGFTGLVTYNLLLVFFVEVCKIPAHVAPIFCTTLNFPINYLLNKYWTFRKKEVIA